MRFIKEELSPATIKKLNSIRDDKPTQETIEVIHYGKLKKSILLVNDHPTPLLPYKIVSTEHIKEDEPLIVYTGVLMESKKLQESDDELENLFVYNIDSIQGVPLVLNAIIEGNEARYFGDSMNEKNANVYTETIVYNHRPYVVYFAKKSIPKDTELLMDWGDTSRSAYSDYIVDLKDNESKNYVYFQDHFDKLPNNWPKDVIFNSGLNWSPDPFKYPNRVLDMGQHYGLLKKDKRNFVMPYIEIEKIKQRGHPCYQHYGVFATQDIPLGTYLGTYAGAVVIGENNSTDINSKKTQKREIDEIIDDYYIPYPMDDEDGVDLVVDAKYEGNESRFVNDYRNIAHEPNVVFKNARAMQLGEPFIAVVTAKNILKGEELLVDYGAEYWEVKANKLQKNMYNMFINID